MAAFDEVVIISGCRTAVGKFQGSLTDLSAPQLGAIVVREAVKRAGLNSDQVDECIMGNVLSCRAGTKSRPPSGNLRRTVTGDRCHDNQQSLWFGIESSGSRSSGRANRKQFDRGCGRHGIHDERSLSAPASAKGISSGQRSGHRFYGARWALGYLQRLPHGHHRRERRGKIRHHARRAG